MRETSLESPAAATELTGVTDASAYRQLSACKTREINDTHKTGGRYAAATLNKT